VASAKRDLRAGEILDGEGGYMVVGRLMPAADSLALGGLPLGLAHQTEASQSRQGRPGVRWAMSPTTPGRGGSGAPRNGVDIRRPQTARSLEN